jgi:acetyltransferase EpsM
MSSNLPPVQAIIIPFLNPNEVEGLLVSLFIQNGKQVMAGEELAVFETTKATAAIVAEKAGFISGLTLTEGQRVHSGEVLCYLVDDPSFIPLPETKLPSINQTGSHDSNEPFLPEGLRITQPALSLARQNHLNLTQLPTGALVTESQIQKILSQNGPVPPKVIRRGAKIVDLDSGDLAGLILYGGGGHGKSVIELVRRLGSYRLVGVVDDGLSPGLDILGVPVLGGKEVLEDLRQRGFHLAVNAVGGIGNLEPRLRVFDMLSKAGFHCPGIVHPTAFIEASAHLGEGIQVFPQAYIGSSAEVGFGVIVNTGAIVSHDCTLGECVNLSPGAILAGGVKVADHTLIGMGVTINLEVKIGSQVRIGNSATIKADVPDGTLVKAGSIWPI